MCLKVSLYKCAFADFWSNGGAGDLAQLCEEKYFLVTGDVKSVLVVENMDRVGEVDKTGQGGDEEPRK